MEPKKRKNSKEHEDPEISNIEESSTQNKKRLLPKKADFRMRAHVNPLKDTPFPQYTNFYLDDFTIKSPLNPDYVDWGIHFPKFFGGNDDENHKLCLNSTYYRNFSN